MAWTDPSGHVWTTAETVTAANMNTYVRLNLQETCPATVTTAGDLVYADAANSMGSRLAIGTAGFALISTGSAPVWRGYAQDQESNTWTTAAGGPLGSSPTSYTDLSDDTWGDGTGSGDVTVTITTGTQAKVTFGARYSQTDTAGATTVLSYRVSGATTAAASNVWGTLNESSAANDRNSMTRVYHHPSLTGGSNTFTLQGFTSAGGVAASLVAPYLIVEAL